MEYSIKQEILEIPFEEIYFNKLASITTLEDTIILSYMTVKCLLCGNDIERHIMEKHLLDQHKAKIFLEGIQVSFQRR